MKGKIMAKQEKDVASYRISDYLYSYSSEVYFLPSSSLN